MSNRTAIINVFITCHINRTYVLVPFPEEAGLSLDFLFHNGIGETFILLLEDGASLATILFTNIYIYILGIIVCATNFQHFV